MTTPEDSARYATKGSADTSPPDSEERRKAMAEAVKDVEDGVAAETYDTDGENTEQ
jgi:hypothetical protein